MTNSEAAALLRPIYDAIALALTALGQAPATTPPPATPPPVVSPPPATVTAISYPIALLDNADKNYLGYMMMTYRVDLRSLPGSHQLLEDMLVDSKGRNVTDFPPNDPLQYLINLIKNGVARGGPLFDPSFTVAGYTGPLKPIYKNLVAAKLAGKA